ncbi:MAG: choice-of-anchor Q domain-containing protein [Candidatus Hydrogenedentales bacterium]|jgi:hypothetical protein
MGKFQVADWSKQLFAAAFLALLLLLTGAPGHAAVLRVNGASAADTPDGSSWANAFKTIQSAVDAAHAQDEIWVAKGTYTGTTDSVVDMSEKMLVLYGGFAGTETSRGERNWDDNNTVIHGEGKRRCVTSNNTGFIDGFTLQNGNAEDGGGMYGGTATNCSFIGNTAEDLGGGMYFGTVSNCTFINNLATGIYGSSGGGMYDGTATNCTFTGNTAPSGGGMFKGTATNCTFTGNTATADWGGGGGMYDGTATNCTFTKNSATNDGGGMRGGTATNCSFTGNTASDLGGGMAGGTATNCTFTGNTAEDLGGGMSGGTATNCILWGNSPNDVFELPNDAYQTSVSYSCLSTAYDGTGNIVGNPDFVNPSAGDFRLRSTSPCINTGTSDGAPAADILGRSRPQGAGLDMGAYEHIPQDDNDAVEPPVLLRVDGASAAVNPDGLSWATAYPTLQAAADKTGYGGEIWVAKGIYTSASGDNVVRLNTGTVMLGGFAGTESDRDQRNWKTNPTVIDGEGERRCVTSNSGCFIDGFTLQNGKAESGGGMSSGTATNCTFTGNRASSGGGMLDGTATNCILWGNYPNDADETSVSYSCLSTAYDGSGNIVGDPDFVNPSAGDFRLRSTSPCIDVGTSDGEDIPSTDIDGVPRPQEAGIDMGAYEYYSPVSVPDVAGKVLADAKSSIKDAGLVVGEVDGQHNNMVTAGSVIIQDPAAGAGVYRGRPVDLIISLGPELF